MVVGGELQRQRADDGDGVWEGGGEGTNGEGEGWCGKVELEVN